MLFESVERLEEIARQVIAAAEFGHLKAERNTVTFCYRKASFVQDGPQLRWSTVDELRAELHYFVLDALGEDPAADAIPSFQDHDGKAGFCESACCC